MTNPFTLIEVDLSKTTTKGSDELYEGPSYLVLYRGSFYIGTFYMQWYGLSFSEIYPAGAQYDPPGTNSSNWQRIWRLDGADEFANNLENEYALSKRKYCSEHGLTLRGKPCTIDMPLEAFGYHPDYSGIVFDEDEDDDECW